MRCNWKISLLLPALCLTSMSFQQDVTHTGFEKFVRQECRISPGKDSCYYIVVEPRMCATCNTSYLRILSAYTRNKPLYIFCDSSKQKEFSAAVKNRNARFITRFNYKELSRQLFMRSGLAFAGSSNGKFNFIEIINGTTLKQYLR